MKILIATGLYPPDIGGPATYVTMLERYLPSRGIKLTVLPYGVVRKYPRILRHVLYTWKLMRLSRSANLLYALDPVSVGLPTYFVHVLTRKPYIVRIAGDYAWEQGQQRFGVTESLDEFVRGGRRHHFMVRILMRVERRVARRARAVIVPSEYLKHIVAAWGIDPSSITVIHSGFHSTIPAETRDEARAMLGYHGTVIASAGRLVPWKGMRTLIGLMPMLKERLGDVTLIIIGDGPLEGALQECARELCVKDSVRFVGRMTWKTLSVALRGADMFVLNTAYEGMSHHILEAMHLGVPVITTEVGGNPELITDGLNGLLVPYDDATRLGDAVLRMAVDADLRARASREALVKAQAFNAERVISTFISFVKQQCL